MTAAFVTIAFLASALLAVVLIAGTIEARLGRIGAALRGRQSAGQLAMHVPVRARFAARRPRAAMARPQLRAAA